MRIVLSILMLLYIVPFYGQDVKQKINEIKKSQDYINAEATEASREEAFTMALEEMTSEVNTLFASHLSSEELRGISNTLDIKRGENMRVFVYTSKEDVKALIASKPVSAGKDTVKVGPDSIQLPKESQNSNTSQSNAVNNSQQLFTSLSTPQVGNVTSVFSRMNTFTEIKSLLRQYKGEGKITNFNWISTRDVSPEVTVIIFKEEKIVAILLQEKNGKRINYLTNKEDSIRNYRGCRAIWYKEK